MKCFLYPDIGRVDEPLQLHMEGLKPNESITMTLTMDHEEMGLWNATGTTHADVNGKLSIGSQGKRDGNEIVRLIWNLRPIDGEATLNYRSNSLKPLTYHLDIEALESHIIESRTLTRLYIEDYIKEELVDDGVISGAFYRPKVRKKLPCILFLGDSMGNTQYELAALFASHGYGALALAYKSKNDSEVPSTIPLEKVYSAIEWLEYHPATNENQIILYGVSRGAELALLVASKSKKISGVIVQSASSYITQGLAKNKKEPVFTEKGERIPTVKYSYTFNNLIQKFNRKVSKRPLSFSDTFRQSIEKYERKGSTEAKIQVESINGPILFISGGNDKLRPSTWMTNKMIKQLEEQSFPHDIKHLSYTEAGHIFVQPYLPALPSTYENIDPGGTPLENAVVGENAWEETLLFLKEHFPPVKIPTVAIPFQTMV